MINVTSAFSRALNNDNRDYREVIEITLRNGATLSLTDQHIWGGTFKIDDAVSSDNELQLGSAIVNRFDFTINNLYDDFSQYDFYGAKVVVKVALLTDVALETVWKGTYVIAEDPVYNGDLIKVTCYDYMYYFDVPYPAGEDAITSYPATAYKVVSDICEYVEIDLETLNFQNKNLVISAPPSEEATTCREVISYVAQMCGCFARCNRFGELELKWFNRTELESVMDNMLDGGVFDDATPYASGDDADGGTFDPWEAGDIFDAGVFTWATTCHYISSLYSHDISVENVAITGVRILVKTEDNASTDSIKTYSLGTNAYVIEIKDNPFITEANVDTVIARLAQQLIGLTFRRARITHGSDPSIEAGDIAILWDRKQNVYPILITHTTFAVGSPQSTISAAQTPVLNATARYGVQTKNYVELRKRLKSERQTMEDALQEAMENASGLYMHEIIDETTTPPTSTIYYHNKPELLDSDIRIVISDVGITVTPNGGETWYGLRVDGQMIASILSATGVNADWINTGALEIRNPNAPLTDPPTFYADCDTGVVNIVANSFSLSNGETLQSVKNYSDAQLSAYQTSMAAIIGDIQDQIDGEIETWYLDYEPTTNNYPASDWTTTALKEEHQGDLFYWKSTGYSYRFLYNDANQDWDWEIISDTYITTAIAKAAEAKDVADGKRRIFVDEPDPPYDIGDLWVQGSTGDILRCANPKATGAQYLETDWVRASKYTDDTLVKTQYGTCTYANTTQNKYVNCPGFVLYPGARIMVSFSYGNLAEAPTLNVNGTGAKPIWAKGAVIAPQYYWRMNALCEFVYEEYLDEGIVKGRWVMMVEDQTEVFNRLTNNSQEQGIWLSGGKIYINASYINTGFLSANRIQGGTLTLGGSGNGNGLLEVLNGSGNKFVRQSAYGYWFGPNLPSSGTATDYNNAANFKIDVSGYITSKLKTANNLDAILEIGSTGMNMRNTVTATSFANPSIEEWDSIDDQMSDEVFGGTVHSYPYETISTWKKSNKHVASITPDGLYADNFSSQAASYLSSGFKLFRGDGVAYTDYMDDCWCYGLNGTRRLVVTTDGHKNKLYDTEDYGDRFLYCYETPTPYFGDIGDGIIGDDGFCYIMIDPIFSKTVSLDQYQVFLQAYGDGKCYIHERHKDYFIVKGEPGLEFGWEMKAKQADGDQLRLDKNEAEIKRDDTNYAIDALTHLNEITINYADESVEHINEINRERGTA